MGRCIHCFGGEDLKKETTWETQAQTEDNITMDLQEVGWEVKWSRQICLRMGTGGKLI
jgi:hypothetical protein